MHQKYYEITRIRTFVAVALAATILSIQAFAHVEIHADISEFQKEAVEKSARDKRNKESDDRVQRDKENGTHEASQEDSNRSNQYEHDHRV